MNASCFTPPLPGHAAWAPSPSCRGTFDILSLCLSTTVICIWSSVHRDIPLERASPIGSFLRVLPLVLVAVLCPELLLNFAIQQFLAARELVHLASKKSNVRPRKGKGNGMMTKYRNILDAILRFFRQDRTQDPDPEQDNVKEPLVGPKRDGGGNMQAKDSKRKHPFTYTHGFYATMGGFAFKFIDNNVQKQAKLTFLGVQFLIEHDPDLIPDLSKTYLTDKQHSSSLGKALLFAQVAWFCLNCISRLVEHKPLSLLEVSTVAHGTITLFCYVAWWSKPLNIDEPTWIPTTGQCDVHRDSDRCDQCRDETDWCCQCKQCKSCQQRRAGDAFALMRVMRGQQGKVLGDLLDSNSPDSARAAHLYYKGDFQTRRITQTETNYVTTRSLPSIADFFRDKSHDSEASLSVAVILVTPIIYGSLHLLGWNAQFPTNPERILWRIATVGVSSSAVALGVIFVAVASLQNKYPRLYSFICVWTGLVAVLLYVLSSSFLLVESIRQLWYLAPEAYIIASWSYYFPHPF